MVSKRPRKRLQDILDNIGHIEAFTDGIDQQMLEQDVEKRFAVERAFLIIAEAVTKLDDLAEQLEPATPWKRIRAFGNIIRHDYDGVDVTDMWSSIQDDLKPLRMSCERLLEHPALKNGD